MKSNTAVATAMDEANEATWVWGLSRREAAILAAIMVASVVIYLPSLRNGWVFDDWEIFVNNKYLNHWSFIWNSFRYDAWWFHNPKILPQSGYYRPVENVFIAAGALLMGNHPAPWHLAKIVLHLVTVVLCFRAAQLLTGEVVVGLLTAAIFGLMPAHVDAVAWVSALSEPLSTAFALGALCCFINRKPGLLGMLSALALYTCALLTHETALLFPLIIAAYVFLIEPGANQQLPRSRRNTETIWNRGIAAARAGVPFAVLALVYLCVRIEVLGFAFARKIRPPAPAIMWVKPPSHHWGGLLDYLLTLPVVLMTYLGVLAVPGIAGPVHDVNWTTSPSAISFVAAGVVVIFAALALVLVLKSSTSDRRLYLFCAAWSLLALAPAMKLDSIWAPVQDRYLYSVSFGWSLALAIAAMRLAAVSPRARSAVGTVTALLLAAYMVTAIRIQHYWLDDVTFFEQCVAVDPVRQEYRRRLADAMDKVGDYKGAARVIEDGSAMDPDDIYLHLRLEQEYMRLGRTKDFEREFQKADKLTHPMLAVPGAAKSVTNPGSAP
jgi:hypothetical protein